LLIARALDGLTGGNISVANAYIADITTEKDRKKNFGKMAVSSNLGFIIGPALAGILGATLYAELLPVLAALVISVVAVGIIIWFLPESKPCPIKSDMKKVSLKRIIGQEHKNCYDPQSSKKLRFRDVFNLPYIPFLLLLTFLIFLGFNFFYTSFPIHAAQTLNWSIPELGIFFAVLSGLMALVQGPVLSKINVRISDIHLILVGNIILGANFVLLISLDTTIIYLAAVLFAVGNGLMWPSFLSYLSKKAGDTYQGSVQGIASSFGSVASIIGLIAGGVLYASIGSYVFLLAALVIFIVVILSLRLLTFENQPIKSHRLNHK
jgi:MFS family permease